LSLAEAGVIGAFVALGVVAIVGAALWIVLRRKNSNKAAPVMERKTSNDGVSSTDAPV
jgi:LPXTG-motif cell wall-anchored protein